MNWWGDCVFVCTQQTNTQSASLHGLNHSSLTHTHTHCAVNEHVNRLAQIQCSNERLVVSIRN